MGALVCIVVIARFQVQNFIDTEFSMNKDVMGSNIAWIVNTPVGCYVGAFILAIFCFGILCVSLFMCNDNKGRVNLIKAHGFIRAKWVSDEG